MIRSPLFYPLARSMDSEAGGAADLQTDVMRFMAILALCLVAIFALVQSIPMEQDAVGKTEPAKVELVVKPPTPKMVARVEKQVPRKPVPKTNPIPEKKPAPKTRSLPPPDISPPVQKMTARTVSTLSPPRTATREPDPQPVETIPTSVDTEEGFTLRFETDLALTQLVARNEVGLYAITGSDALRMTINRDKAEFWSASLPKQYHEMDEATVPESIVSALRTSGGRDVVPAHWGVTLPTAMSKSLNQYMNENRGGTLIIGTDGILRLAH